MRSLARGLNVLDYVARNDGVTFTQIVHATGLSKGVVHRILGELTRSGFAWRLQSDKKYFASPLVAATPGGSYAKLLLSAAAEPMSWLVKQIKWPSDLFVHEGLHMVMLESTRPSSPFHLRWSRIGRNAPILLSSVGRAVLGEIPENQKEAIYEKLRESGDWRVQTNWLSQPIEDILKEVNQLGYAEREVRYAGPALERGGERSIAVAVSAQGVVLGAINVWWPHSADAENRLIDEVKEHLFTCKSMIEGNLKRSSPTGLERPAQD